MGAPGLLVLRAVDDVLGQLALGQVLDGDALEHVAQAAACRDPHRLQHRGRVVVGDRLRPQTVDADQWAVDGPDDIRGSDVTHTPLPLAFAIVPREGRPTLYVDGRKLSNEVRSQLEALTDVREPADFVPDLAALGKAKKTVRLDQATAADALARMIVSHGGKAPRGADPITLMKAVKNSVEIEGSRAAHRRDGAAVARFLAWLEREAPAGKLTEIEAVEALESFRREGGLLKDVSFPTISGAGPNGAIVHYRVTRKTNRVIKPGELFLIDSGAQYEDGTTDITRTVAIGEPTPEMRGWIGSAVIMSNCLSLIARKLRPSSIRR